MKTTMSLAMGACCIGLIATLFVVKPVLGAVGTGPSFKGPLGLQLYSLRDQFAKDVPDENNKLAT